MWIFCRDFVLRRTKAEVLNDKLPQKAEIIVPVRMTALQKRLSRTILEKNPELLRTVVAKGNISAAVLQNLGNILLGLRKCMCHPYLYDSNIEEQVDNPEEELKRLTSACGKLELLSIMLPRLIETGHRVLIFSQFLGMMTILEDFLVLLKIKYARLDGSLSSMERQQRIDAFNAEGSDLSVFLLSTRAGGVGINLGKSHALRAYIISAHKIRSLGRYCNCIRS